MLNLDGQTLHFYSIFGPLVSEAEKGWCGGLIDGEGCITLSKNSRKNIQPHVAINMTHEATIKRFHKLIKLGNVCFCPSLKIKWKPTWLWRVTSLQAILVIKNLQSYIFTKTEQAKLLLEYAEKCYIPNNNGQRVSDKNLILREILWEEMQNFNKKGIKCDNL